MLPVILFLLSLILFVFSLSLLYQLKSVTKRYEIAEQNVAKAELAFYELEQKFKKNPSMECQQLLADILSGHALFHIETISPQNVLLKR